MKQLAAAAVALGLFSLVPAAGAQTTTSWTMTVDAVSVTATGVVVKGVVQGATEPSLHGFVLTGNPTEAARIAALDRCHRSLLIALAKPGQYVATIGYDVCSVALIAP